MATDRVVGDSAAATADAVHEAPALGTAAPAAPVPLPVASAVEVGHAEDPAEHDADRRAAQALDRLRRLSAEPTESPDGRLAGPSRHQHDPGCGHLRRASDPGAVTGSAIGVAGGVLPSESAGTISRLRGSGRPLEPQVRLRMEDGFGASFSGVRVHDGPEAAQLNRSVSALAFTTGRDVFFGAGTYRPDTAEGERVLAHELAHTLQPDQGLQRLHRGGGELSGSVVRRVLAGPLAGKNAQYLIGELKIPWAQANRAIKAEKELTSLDEVRTFLAEDVPKTPDPRMLEGASAATASSSSVKTGSAKSGKEDVGPSSSGPLPKAVVPSSAAKSHQPVSRGGKRIIVNFVSLGPSRLDDVSRFNIYSWRALGHAVNIFTHSLTWTSDARATFAPKRHAELGLEEGDATVVDLSGVIPIARDGEVVTDAPSLLSAWLRRAPVGEPPRQYIFNVGDVVKSYVGGMHQGITMDLKVGPSLHLQDYADDFETQFISYSRGGQSSGPVENQSMGTMQDGGALRDAYRTAFDTRVRGLAGTDPVNDVNFNLITGYHGAAWNATGAGRDVAKDLPVTDQRDTVGPKPKGFGPTVQQRQKKYDEDVSGRMSSQFGVDEIGDPGTGPFRVFKKATDQTNKSGNVPTTDAQRLGLMEFAWEKELAESGGDRGFLDKARGIKEQFAKKVAEEEGKR
jgi:hypothetical protein